MQTLLGVVTGTNRDKYGEPVAWVKPLFETTGSWREADPEEFPTRGFLFWAQAKDAVRDGLVFLKARENSFRLPGLKDDFMVADPHPALEVIDLRKHGDEEHVRVALNAGIRLSGVLAGRALIWCGDNTVLGPVGLVVAQSRVTLEQANRARIPCFRLKQGDIRAVTHDGLTRYVVARPTLGQPDGFIDWDDDKLVVRRALEFAVGVAKRSEAIRLTKQMIGDAAEQIAGTNSPPETALESYRLQRTKRLIKGLETANHLASEVASALQVHPAVAKRP